MSSNNHPEKLKKYEYLYNSMNQGVVYQNAEGHITDANPAAQRLLGVSLDQLQGRESIDPRWKAIKEDGSDFPGEKHPAMRSLKTGETIKNEIMGIYHPQKDSHVWILVSAEPVFEDHSDEPVEVYTTFTDITERVISEKQLKHQTELQIILTDISGSFINTRDFTADNVINHSLEKLGEYLNADRIYIFDYEHEIKNIRNTYEWCNKGIEPQIENLQETPFSEAEEWVEAHFRGETLNIPDVFELDEDDDTRQFLEPQGIKSIITVPVFDNDQCIGFVGVDSVADHKIYGDIDEKILRIYAQLLVNLYKQKSAQKEISEKQSFLEDIFESTNSLIATKSTDGKYLLVNRKWTETTGLTAEKCIGKTDFDLFPPDIAQQFWDNDRSALKHNKLIETEEILLDEESGQNRYFLSNKFPVKDHNNDTKGLCFITHEITDRKEAENQLKDTNQRLQKLLDSQTNYVVRTDLEGNLVYANRKYEEEFGWLHNRDEIIGKSGLVSIMDYHHQRTRETVEYCLKHPGSIKKVELDKPLKDGTVQTTLWEFVCLTDNDGNPFEIQSMGFDITKEKKATEKLKKSEKKYKTLFQDSPDGYLILSEGKFIDCNSAALNILGYEDKDQLVGKSPAQISPEYQPDGHTSEKNAKFFIQSAEEKGTTNFEWELMKADGTKVLIKVSLTQIEYEEKEVLFVTWRDITEQKKNEQQIRLLSEVIEQSPMYVVITDPKGKPRYVNSSLVQKTGFTREEIFASKKELWKSGYHSKEFYKNLWDTISSGNKWTGEFYNKTKDGEYFWENAVIFPIKDDKGKIRHFVGVKEDITIKKQAEEERIARKEAEASNEAKSKFLSRMSHEFRTPLNAIMSYSYILEQSGTQDYKQLRQLQAINRSGNHLLQLIEDILDFSKIETTEIEINNKTFSPFELLNDLNLMFEQKASDKGIYIHSDTGKLPAYITADEGKIRQIIVNILGNAVKFTDHGGVTIKAHIKPKKKNTKTRLLFSIADTGPGMTEKEISKIFTEFKQFSAGEKAGGTGLGMSISKGLTDAMNGLLNIESEPGKGTVMTVELPVEIPNEEESQQVSSTTVSAIKNSEPHPTTKDNITLLIVDDNEDNRDTLHDLLEPYGYNIHTAVDGIEGVEQAENIKPDIILMDIQMPGLNGYEASLKIKSRLGETVKIIAVTASEYERDQQKLSDHGLDDYLRKPFQPNDLFETIKYWISQIG